MQEITVTARISDKGMAEVFNWNEFWKQAFREVYPTLSKKYNGNKSKIAKAIGLNRNTLNRYVKEYIDNYTPPEEKKAMEFHVYIKKCFKCGERYESLTKKGLYCTKCKGV